MAAQPLCVPLALISPGYTTHRGNGQFHTALTLGLQHSQSRKGQLLPLWPHPCHLLPSSLPGWLSCPGQQLLHSSTALQLCFSSVLLYGPFSTHKRTSCFSHPKQQAFPLFSHINTHSTFIHNASNRKQSKCQSKRK